jgi:hypothetical protein
MQHNKPDIVVHDKVKNYIIIMKTGITSQDQLQSVEAEKIKNILCWQKTRNDLQM